MPAAAERLDRLANNVSADHLGGQREGEAEGHFKGFRHRLRRISGEIIGGRQRQCGCKALNATVRLSDHGYFEGLETCGSVWTCPVCSVRVTEARRDEVRTVVDAHRRAGGRVAMATLTIPHYAPDRCADLKSTVQRTWRKVQQGRQWRDRFKRFGWDGQIRALEVLHGGHGWHPHLHVLILFRAETSDRQVAAFADWLYGRWARFAYAETGRDCSRDAFDWRELQDGEDGDYLGKWGAAEELTKAQWKAGTGRTPWEILASIHQGEDERSAARDRELFREYAQAFKGSRQLTWSRGLRTRYLDAEDVTDEELAAEPAMEPDAEAAAQKRLPAVDFHKSIWKPLALAGWQADLMLAQQDGFAAVLDVVDRAGLDYEVLYDTPDQVPLLRPPGTYETPGCMAVWGDAFPGPP